MAFLRNLIVHDIVTRLHITELVRFFFTAQRLYLASQRTADIFRLEDNIVDLYVMLLRFSSLVSETIPRHRDYRASSQSYKSSLKKKLLNAVIELEKLKPRVQSRVDELNNKHIYQANGQDRLLQNGSIVSSPQWPPIGKQSTASDVLTKETGSRGYHLDERGNTRDEEMQHGRSLILGMKRKATKRPQRDTTSQEEARKVHCQGVFARTQ